MKKPKLIVFDMDGVLIDVSMSYRDTVRQTARLFFKVAANWDQLPDPLFPLSDLAVVKQSGGLNNDWDLTFMAINLLFTLVEAPDRAPAPKKEDTGSLEGEDNWDLYTKSVSEWDVGNLEQFLKDTKTPLGLLLEKEGRPRDAYIASFYEGDVGTGNIIKQIFQEVYLGRALFERTYGKPPKVWFEEGFIHREKILVGKDILENLGRDNILAIATGRPRAEAEYPLVSFGLEKFFRSMYCLEDCINEEERVLAEEGRIISLSKPDPFMLDAIAQGLEGEYSGCYYIGDMPDDMVAATTSKAGFKGVGVVASAPDRDALKKSLLGAGADFIIEELSELEKIIK